jgi:hypothetical protein
VKHPIAIFLIAIFALPACATPCFDDENLLRLQTSAAQRGTLVYVWSPRMVYSVQNVATASRAAAASGLDFVVLHDVRVPADEIKHARALSQKSSWLGSGSDWATPPVVSPLDASRPLCSEQLFEREALRHFPSAFVIGKLGIHQHAIVGAMPLQAWMRSIEQRQGTP